MLACVHTHTHTHAHACTHTHTHTHIHAHTQTGTHARTHICTKASNYFKILVLRALGIPSRPVTNYDSAHDTEANRTIDFYFDQYGDKLNDKSADSIWYDISSNRT